MKSYPNIYFPMTCNVLTVGHIKCLEYLTQYGFVTVGLLTSKALKGYKKEVMSFEDRKYILDTISQAVEDVYVIPQDSLDPSRNLKHYGYFTHMASGDGFEECELKAMKKFKLKKIEIKLDGEKKKKWNASSYYANPY